MRDNIVWHSRPEPRSLPVGECHLYRMRFDENDPRIARCLTWLDVEEKARVNRARIAMDRARLILARGTLRQLLSGYLDQPARAVRFFYNEQGKPYLTAPISFNVSHAHDTILFAFSGDDAPVGVDVEYAHRSHNLLRIAYRYFSEEEFAYLVRLPPNALEACFYHVWTQKEAFVKAQGQGLSYGLSSFTVNCDPSQGAGLVSVDAEVSEEDRWLLKSFVPYEGMAAAIAIRQAGVEIIAYNL